MGPGPSQISPRLYISGDKLIFGHLKEIPQRYPDIDPVMLHLGGTKILGARVTTDAEQGIEAIHVVQPKQVIPIHYNDYTVFKSTLDEFMQAVSRAGLDDRVYYLKHGDTFSFDQLKRQADPIKR
ncbi:MAG: metal-dependent hydrolase [Methanocella sp. PtaU1.Bin125]|nr:MAG: metal-dependent hydrolase [Methanocella sp. PtaU1.Bin125]